MKEQIPQGRSVPSMEAFESLGRAIESKRTGLVGELLRMRYRQEVTLEMRDGRLVRGFLHGCNGAEVRFTDGQTFRLMSVRGVVMHSQTDCRG